MNRHHKSKSVYTNRGQFFRHDFASRGDSWILVVTLEPYGLTLNPKGEHTPTLQGT
jgi:hypothetical protein